MNVKLLSPKRRISLEDLPGIILTPTIDSETALKEINQIIDTYLVNEVANKESKVHGGNLHHFIHFFQSIQSRVEHERLKLVEDYKIESKKEEKEEKKKQKRNDDLSKKASAEFCNLLKQNEEIKEGNNMPAQNAKTGSVVKQLRTPLTKMPLFTAIEFENKNGAVGFVLPTKEERLEIKKGNKIFKFQYVDDHTAEDGKTISYKNKEGEIVESAKKIHNKVDFDSRDGRRIDHLDPELFQAVKTKMCLPERTTKKQVMRILLAVMGVKFKRYYEFEADEIVGIFKKYKIAA